MVCPRCGTCGHCGEVIPHMSRPAVRPVEYPNPWFTNYQINEGGRWRTETAYGALKWVQPGEME